MTSWVQISCSTVGVPEFECCLISSPACGGGCTSLPCSATNTCSAVNQFDSSASFTNFIYKQRIKNQKSQMTTFWSWCRQNFSQRLTLIEPRLESPLVNFPLGPGFKPRLSAWTWRPTAWQEPVSSTSTFRWTMFLRQVRSYQEGLGL